MAVRLLWLLLGILAQSCVPYLFLGWYWLDLSRILLTDLKPWQMFWPVQTIVAGKSPSKATICIYMSYVSKVKHPKKCLEIVKFPLVKSEIAVLSTHSPGLCDAARPIGPIGGWRQEASRMACACWDGELCANMHMRGINDTTNGL